MAIGERIKQLRKTKGMTMEVFGERIGIKAASLSTIENEKNNPSFQTLKSICREFGVNESWLRTGEGEMYVARPEEEELPEAVERLMSGESAAFKRRLVYVLSRLQESEWIILQDKLREILDEKSAEASEETYEQEARRKAEEYYQQLLAEKNGKTSEDSSPNSGAAGRADLTA